ncbi:hypothetical protein MJ579_19325 [Klebsiella pneumoniae]|nr:hypothetical protein MJ579_19325 [Klebsiella pneumoniae]
MLDKDLEAPIAANQRVGEISHCMTTTRWWGLSAGHPRKHQ